MKTVGRIAMTGEYRLSHLEYILSRAKELGATHFRLTDDESIDLLQEEIKEETYSFSFNYLTNRVEWTELCELIGVDYYKKAMVSRDEVFNIKESDCRKYGLL